MADQTDDVRIKFCSRKSSETGAKFVAWFQMVTAVLGLILIFGLILSKPRDSMNRREQDTMFLWSGACVICFFMGLALLRGVIKKNGNYLTAWLIYAVISLLGTVVMETYSLDWSRMKTRFPVLCIGAVMASIFISLVCKLRCEMMMADDDQESDSGGGQCRTACAFGPGLAPLAQCEA